MVLLGQLIRPVVWLQALPGTQQAKSPGTDCQPTLPLLLAQTQVLRSYSFLLRLYPALRGSVTQGGLELVSLMQL